MSKLLRSMLVAGGFLGGEGEGDDGDAVGTGNDARVALLNSIGDNADRGRAEEFADVNEDGSTSAFVAPPAADDDPEAAQAEADRIAEETRVAAEAEAARVEAEAATAAAAAPNFDTGTGKIIRKINGIDTEITEEMLVKASKIAAGDVYLAEAKRLKEEAAGTAASSQEETVNDDLASVARAIQMGTEEEAVAALRKLAPKGLSQDDLSKKIDERLTFNGAYERFKTDFKDVQEDPVLRKLAEDMDSRLVSEGDQRSYHDRFQFIGTSVRKWVQSKAPQAPKEEAVVISDDKQMRKEAAPQVPAQAKAKHAVPVEEEKEESAAEVIARMAAQRGGPQWMAGQAQNR